MSIAFAFTPKLASNHHVNYKNKTAKNEANNSQIRNISGSN